MVVGLMKLVVKVVSQSITNYENHISNILKEIWLVLCHNIIAIDGKVKMGEATTAFSHEQSWNLKFSYQNFKLKKV